MTAQESVLGQAAVDMELVQSRLGYMVPVLEGSMERAGMDYARVDGLRMACDRGTVDVGGDLLAAVHSAVECIAHLVRSRNEGVEVAEKVKRSAFMRTRRLDHPTREGGAAMIRDHHHPSRRTTKESYVPDGAASRLGGLDR